jgi:hypothetical protein
MNQFKFLAPITVAVSMTLFLFSCNSGEEKKTDETTADTTAVKAPEPTPTPTPAPKPANVLIIQHKVANFAKWKPVYESHDSTRRSYGLTNYVLGRGLTDSNMVLVVLKMDDVNKAKELTGSQGMKDRMQKAGVTGKPTFTYLEVVMDDNSTIEQTARLMMTAKVKDWDAWKKEFDDHKPARMEAGLIDRGLGYSAGDNHIVSIVFAVTDMQKATAFLKSPDLKAKMAKSGVEGQPTSFFYNIVQKY